MEKDYQSKNGQNYNARLDKGRKQVDSHDFEMLLDALPLGIWKECPKGQVHYINRMYRENFGIVEEIPNGPSVLSESQGGMFKRSQKESKPDVRYEKRQLPDGSIREIEVTRVKLQGRDGEILGVIGYSQDITEKRRIEEEYHRVKHYLEDAQKMARLGNWVYEMETGVLWWSQQIYSILGLDETKVQPSFEAYLAMVHPDERHLLQLNYLESVKCNKTCSLSHRIQMEDGSIRYVEERIAHVCDENGRVIRSLGTLMDITDREVLSQVAYHDSLTGLTNRRMFEEHLQYALRKARRHQQRFALLFCDLDNFKSINDELGHGAGDQVLIHTANTLQASLREADLVCRWGGDEFIILLATCSSAAHARVVGEKLIKAVAQPFEYCGNTLMIGMSVGASVFPENGKTMDKLLGSADEAMYDAKNAGKGLFEIKPEDFF